jgi:ABC-type uncharacterized transport system ATPase component
MNSKLSNLIVSATFIALSAGFTASAVAADVNMVGPVTKITMAADGKSATAVLKDGKSGALVTITIKDDLTLDKFKDKRIGVGDEIRTRYDNEANNLAKSFKKTAGC